MSSEKIESDKNKSGMVDFFSIDLYSLLELFIVILNEKVWRYIGLRVDPQTEKINRNFEKAHLAIDCIISLVDKLENKISQDKINEFRNMITELQMNYVNQLNKK